MYECFVLQVDLWVDLLVDLECQKVTQYEKVEPVIEERPQPVKWNRS